MQVQRPVGRRQQDVESKNKNCDRYNWALGTIMKGLDKLPSHLSAIQLQVTLKSTAHCIREVLE
jgi:hypothetical protein